MAPSKTSVELLTRIANLGKEGDIIEVSTTQARNYLIPKKLAKEVTHERLKQLESQKKRSQDQARLRLEQAYEMQKNLDGQSLSFTLKGKNGKIFGGINEHDIATRVKQKFGYDFEKHDIKLPNKTHIKTTGTHLVYLHITHESVAKIIVEVSIDE